MKNRPTIHALESRRLLSAALSVSAAPLVFNAVHGTTSPTETLTLTNAGDAPLALSSVTLAGAAAGRFAVTNAPPATLAAGASFGLTMTYAPTAVGLDVAELDVATGVGPTAVPLSGIGTAGLGGTNQPSLERVLHAYDLPNYNAVGETDETNPLLPEPPAANSTEVDLQQMVKAGPGDVTVTPLASFVAEAAAPYLLYWYGTAAGPAASGQLLFHTVQSEYQTVSVHPVGNTGFDPGSAAFGFYTPSQTVRVNGQLVTGYTQDALNTYDATDARKFRFFPYVNPAGTAVPDTYLMASTEWYAPDGYDFVNLVAIVSNVRPAAPAAAADTATATAGVASAIDVTANDAATTGALAAVTVTTPPASGGTATVDPATGTVTYTAPAGFVGHDTFAYTVANSAGYTSAPATVTVAVAAPVVTPIPTPPPTVVTPTATTAAVNTPVTLNALAAVSDPSSPLVASSVQLTSAPAGAGTTTTHADGTVTFTPAVGFVGPYSFAYTVADVAGHTSDPVTVTVGVGVPVGSVAGDRRSVAVGGATVTLNRGTALVVPAAAGTVAVDKAGRATVAGAAAVASITLAGTTAASRLTVGGAAAATIANLTAATALGAIVAPRATLTGTVLLAAVNSVSVAAITGANLTAASIGTLAVRGAIANATVTTAGNVGHLTAASLAGDAIDVGVPAATTPDATALGSAVLGTVRTTAFAGTTIIAHALTTAALGTVDTTSGGGVTVATTRSITGTAAGKRFRGAASQAFGTFAIRVG